MGRTDFHTLDEYLRPVSGYCLLPLRFKRTSRDELLLSNDVGEFTFISNADFQQLVSGTLDSQSRTYLDLRSKWFLSDERSSIHSRVLAS